MSDPARVAAERIHGSGIECQAEPLRKFRAGEYTVKQCCDAVMEGGAAIIRAAYADQEAAFARMEARANIAEQKCAEHESRLDAIRELVEARS